MGTSCMGTYENFVRGIFVRGNLRELRAWRQGVFTPCLCVARCFYSTLLRCKAFSHCGFALCFVLALYMLTFYEPMHKFSEPKHMFS